VRAASPGVKTDGYNVNGSSAVEGMQKTTRRQLTFDRGHLVFIKHPRRWRKCVGGRKLIHGPQSLDELTLRNHNAMLGLHASRTI